jgi:hypothetical protein
MTRRSLVHGIKPDPALEQQFVRAGKLASSEAKPQPDTQPGPRESAPSDTKEHGTKLISRSSFSTRIRGDYGAALKRASLERQLSGITPNSIQGIVEDALEPWLRKNGYLQ